MRLTLASNVVPIAFNCAKRCRSEGLRINTAFADLPLSACQALLLKDHADHVEKIVLRHVQYCRVLAQRTEVLCHRFRISRHAARPITQLECEVPARLRGNYCGVLDCAWIHPASATRIERCNGSDCRIAKPVDAVSLRQLSDRG